MPRLASRSSKKTWSGLASSGPWYTSNQLRGPGSHHSSTINARTMAEQLPQNSGWLSTKHINITTSTYHYHRFCVQKLLHVGQFYLKRTFSIPVYDTYYNREMLYCSHVWKSVVIERFVLWLGTRRNWYRLQPTAQTSFATNKKKDTTAVTVLI